MLTLVSVPIGNPKDITLRALEVLKAADGIILEQRKTGFALLKEYEFKPKEFRELNEHTQPDELLEMAALAEKGNWCLITDAGTPSFCDPGAHLVSLCREKNIPVASAPGASSLMVLLSLSSERIDEFVFRGFLPKEDQSRAQALQIISKETRPVVILETPYRTQKLITELSKFGSRKVLVTTNLTTPEERICEGKACDLRVDFFEKKSEIIVLLYALK